jgi:hypothetical protein
MLTSACVHVVDRSAGEREMDGWWIDLTWPAISCEIQVRRNECARRHLISPPSMATCSGSLQVAKNNTVVQSYHPLSGR